MKVMSTVPPQGRIGLLHFVLAIEDEADALAAERADAALFDLEQHPSHPGIRTAYRRAVMSAIIGNAPTRLSS